MAIALYCGNLTNGYSGSGTVWGSEMLVWGYPIYLGFVSLVLQFINIIPYGLSIRMMEKWKRTNKIVSTT